ncbi:ABC transporter substrate-binding protein [Cellulomonas marina]|uniref:Thiamine pyrimidine synthase n=1 Tax=Cellulomonas marina TaxID=988821 RepID=A0A1I0VC80_9CELL|nr:ABC transporter substrate-binding protein [Cellulomonas marina]GIG28050.1 nitrate ABC transporter substrate-binding protein [Cellulomonas marina]SFA73941.1 NitT/TauT family transport system substrate-binding protein [Cellulomonas marina]
MTRTPRAALRLTAAGLGLALALTACSSGGGDAEPAASGSGGEGGLTPVKLQLQWFTQAQFAGYYAALEQGFYEDAGLDVEIVEGGVDIVPQTELANGAVDYAIAWVPKALASREQGAGITDVAQIFQRSGTLQVSFADAGIDSAADLAGKKVGNWGFGNEFELFAGMTAAGLDPATDVTLVQQQFDMNALLSGEIDAAQAMTYNEYAQVLEAENPETGELYRPEDFSVVDWNEEGTAMLQDAIWANSERLASDEEYQETTVAFIKASIQGWVFARDEAEAARDLVVAAGSQLGNSHQLWQVNEVNKLIWPSPDGIGTIDEDLWDQTVEVALTAKNDQGATVITAEPDAEAYTNEYVEQALAELEAEGVDVTGEGFQPLTVTLEAGGA